MEARRPRPAGIARETLRDGFVSFGKSGTSLSESLPKIMECRSEARRPLEETQPGGLFSSKSAPMLFTSNPKETRQDLFVKRQLSHASIEARRKLAMRKTNFVLERHAEENVKLPGMHGVEGFRQYLVTQYGSILAGWRRLDPERIGRLSFVQFSTSLRRLGYHGNLKSLWNELNRTGDGFISIMDIDPEVGQIVGTFKLKLKQEYGTILEAWNKALDKKRLGQIERSDVGACCKQLGLDLDVKKLWEMLRPHPMKGLSLKLEDFDIDAYHQSRTEDRSSEASQAPCIDKDQPWMASNAWKGRPHKAPIIPPLSTAESFKRAMVDRFGSLFAAWRQGLDPHARGHLSFDQFSRAVRELRYSCFNLKDLWPQLDKEGRGLLLFADLDPATDKFISEARAALEAKFGNLMVAWVKGFDAAGEGSVTLQDFVKICKAAGFKGDSERFFRLLKPLGGRLSLWDFDAKAYKAHSRGDFRMLTEAEEKARVGNKTKLEMTIVERTENSFPNQLARAKRLACSANFASSCNLVDARKQVPPPKEKFEDICIRSFGTMVAAWRLALDKHCKGRLNFQQFCDAIRLLGFLGNFKEVWAKYDKGRKGHVSLHDLDSKADEALTAFLKLLRDNYGDLHVAWRKGFGKDPSLKVDFRGLLQLCRQHRYVFDVRLLFSCLQPRPKLKTFVLWDVHPLFLLHVRTTGQGFVPLPSEAEARKLAEASWASLLGSTTVATDSAQDEAAELWKSSIRGTASKQGAVLKAGSSLMTTKRIPDENLVDTKQLKESLRRRMELIFGSTVAGWRLEVDKHSKGFGTLGNLCLLLDRMAFRCNVKALWRSLCGDAENIVFENIDPDSQDRLSALCSQLVTKCGTILEFWYTHSGAPELGGKIGVGDFLAALERCGVAVEDPASVFQLFFVRHGQRLISKQDFMAILIGVPVQKRDEVWGYDKEEVIPSQKEVVEQRIQEDKCLLRPIATLGGLKYILISKFGSLFSGWRKLLDKDQNGVVTYSNFISACDFLGVQNVSKIWSDLDRTDRGQLRLSDLDPMLAEAFAKFEELLVEQYGHPKDGWRAVFRVEHRGRRCERDSFVKGCVKLGYTGNAAKLYDMLRPEVGRSYLYYEDLWENMNINDFEPKHKGQVDYRSPLGVKKRRPPPVPTRRPYEKIEEGPPPQKETTQEKREDGFDATRMRFTHPMQATNSSPQSLLSTGDKSPKDDLSEAIVSLQESSEKPTPAENPPPRPWRQPRRTLAERTEEAKKRLAAIVEIPYQRVSEEAFRSGAHFEASAYFSKPFDSAKSPAHSFFAVHSLEDSGSAIADPVEDLEAALTANSPVAVPPAASPVALASAASPASKGSSHHAEATTVDKTYVEVMYDFMAVKDDDWVLEEGPLAVIAGQRLEVLMDDGGDWLYGRLVSDNNADMVGYVPKAYTRPIVSEGDATQEDSKPVFVKALYAFDPSMMDEWEMEEDPLALEEGDIIEVIKNDGSDWIFGRLPNNVEGYFPADYVEPYERSDVVVQASGTAVADSIDVHPDAAEVASLVSRTDSRVEVAKLKSGRRYVYALYDFEASEMSSVDDWPNEEGPMSINENQRMQVLEDDGGEWIYGCLVDFPDVKGYVPRAYVAPLNESSDDESVEYVEALYAFDADDMEWEMEEPPLTLEEGDIVQVISNDGGDWIHGRLVSHPEISGYVPSSYVRSCAAPIQVAKIEVVDPEKETCDDKEYVEALYNFDGECMDWELEEPPLPLQEGDIIEVISNHGGDWIHGRLVSRPEISGYCPAGYIKPCATSSKVKDSRATEPSEGKEYVEALYSFDAEGLDWDMDEPPLQLQEGDMVEVISNDGGDWIHGRLVSHPEISGYFPIAYTQPADGKVKKKLAFELEDARSEKSAKSPLHGLRPALHPSKTIRFIEVLYDFDPSGLDWEHDEGPLPVVAGDILEILRDDDPDWIFACHTDNREAKGYLPRTYCEQVEKVLVEATYNFDMTGFESEWTLDVPPLPFKVGDKIVVIDDDEGDWIYGQIDGKPQVRGLFPRSYVVPFIETGSQKSPHTLSQQVSLYDVTVPQKSGVIVTVKHDFDASTTDWELDERPLAVRQGQTLEVVRDDCKDWIFVRFVEDTESVGYVPRAYVSFEPPVLMEAAFDFAPSTAEWPLEDPPLILKTGQIVQVVDDDGGDWIVGQLADAPGTQGLFPREYMVYVDESSRASALSTRRRSNLRAAFAFDPAMCDAPRDGIDLLALDEGDVVEVVSREGEDWVHVEGGKGQGYCPRNYLELMDDATRRPKTAERPKYMRTVFEFDPSTIEWNLQEPPLALNADEIVEVLDDQDEEWIYGRRVKRREVKGFFPKGYVAEIEREAEALFDFGPVSEEWSLDVPPLPFEEGDRLEIIDDSEDCWFFGRKLLDGVEGFFPKSYVELKSS